nr:hybrid sensor histidine kinase/response regulator [Duganella guangzhouensis]
MWPLPEQRLLAEQLRLLYGNVGASVIPALLLAALLVYTLQNDVNRSALLAWAAGVIVSKLYAFADARRRLADGIAPGQERRLVLHLTVLHAVDGAAWGALAWVALGSTTMTGSIMVLAVLTGILGSSMSLLAPVLPTFLAFSLALIVLAISWLWQSGDTSYRALSLTGLLYVVSLAGQARNSNLAALAAIKLRFENLDLMKAEEEARRSAEYANLAKTKFLAAASHDLRQPIHAQGLFLDVLARSGLTAHQDEVLASARSAWQASSDMLNTLLDFSRIEAGVVQPHPQPFDLQGLLNQIENDLAPLADAKGLFYRSRETALTVESDERLVEMVLRNLVSNAIRYTERGGVLVACRRRGASVQVEVWDTGIGIAAADQREIFREFHQLGNPERDRNKGLGLGLAIAQGLAGALDLRLSLSSRPGRGSVFRIVLPVVPSGTVAGAMTGTAGALATPPHAAEALPPGLRVLVIDDDQSILAGMAQLLESWGCACDTASSLSEALALATRAAPAWTPSVIISDYRLREQQTGAQAIAALRAALGRHVPALVITGDTAPERLREAMATGDPLLHKPVKPEQLYQALFNLTKEETYQ